MTAFDFTGASAPDERRIEVPAHLADKRALLSLLAHGFPLPAYFGHNWDALEECLVDLDWMKEPRTALVHHDVPLAGGERLAYLKILAIAASPRLRVIFPASCRPEVAAAFSYTT